MKLPFFLVVAIYGVRAKDALQKFYANQDLLYTNLLKNYNPRLSAVYPENVTDTVFNVDIWLTFMKLFVVSVPEESVTLLFEFEKIWTDTRLTWNPADYGGIDHIYVNKADIWIAETSLVEVATFEDIRPDDGQIARVTHNGTVRFYVASTVKTICNFKVENFPFDKQKCGVHFYPLSIDFNEYNMSHYIRDFFTIDTTGNAEWNVMNVTTSISVLPDGVYMQTFDIYLERYSTYYVTMVVLPSFVLNVISVFGVFLKDGDSIGKLMIGLTNILSLTFIFGIISENLPTTKYLPLLGYYVLINLCIMVGSVLIVMILPSLQTYTTRFSKYSERRKLRLCTTLSSHFSISGILLSLLQFANLMNLVYFMFL